jgi:NADH pyrophosphatase NudC (nudix superfamily)
MRETHPLKAMRYCPKCGSSEFKVAGERSLKCKSCGFHYFINAAAAVAALVVNTDGKIMLTTRGINPNYGMLDLPGGFVDPMESVEDALRRELDEELGLKVKSFEYLGSAPNEYVFSEFSTFTIDLAYKVTPETTEGLCAMDDILDYKFYSEEEIDYNEIPAPSIKHFVQQYFQNERNKITG